MWLNDPDYRVVQRKSCWLAAVWMAAAAGFYAGLIGAVLIPAWLLWSWFWQWQGADEARGLGRTLILAAGAFALNAAVAAVSAALKAHARKRAGTYDWPS